MCGGADKEGLVVGCLLSHLLGSSPSPAYAHTQPRRSTNNGGYTLRLPLLRTPSASASESITCWTKFTVLSGRPEIWEQCCAWQMIYTSPLRLIPLCSAISSQSCLKHPSSQAYFQETNSQAWTSNHIRNCSCLARCTWAAFPTTCWSSSALLYTAHPSCRVLQCRALGKGCQWGGRVGKCVFCRSAYGNLSGSIYWIGSSHFFSN